MGKPGDASPRKAATPTPSSSSRASAAARHTPALPPQQRYRDDVEADETTTTTDDDDDDEGGNHQDDLPPLYTDHEEFNDAEHTVFDPLLPRWRRDDGFETVHSFRQDDTTTWFLDPRLDRDPDFLASHIDKLSMVPPRPFVRLVGTHREKSSSSDSNKRDSSTVFDFEIEIELTHLLYSDIRNAQAWRRLHVAGNFEKVRRGTVCTTRAPGFGGSGGNIPEEGTPGLREWCRRYCASRAGLKCFTMERRVEGFDWDLLRRRLEGLARATNYRGRLDVDFPLRNARVHVYNDCRVNRWRLTRWIVLVFTCTLLFVFTWPWLYFRTRRWETVTAEWALSDDAQQPPGRRKRYASVSEEQWYAMWAATIQRAMLERRRGTLDQGDLERTASAGNRQDGFVGVMQVGMEAMGVVNRSFGWGADTC